MGNKTAIMGIKSWNLASPYQQERLLLINA